MEEKGDGVPLELPKDSCEISSAPMGDPLAVKWSSLFSFKPKGKSSFLAVKVILDMSDGSCAIAILDELVDHSIAAMASTLVGKFIGPRPNIDVVKDFIKKKWVLKG